MSEPDLVARLRIWGSVGEVEPDYDCLLAASEIERLRGALAYIAGKHQAARDAVANGSHNTTFAIDLSGVAKMAMEGMTIWPDGSGSVTDSAPGSKK